MGEVRVQDEQGTVHVFPDGSTPEMISQAMGVKPPPRSYPSISAGMPTGFKPYPAPTDAYAVKPNTFKSLLSSAGIPTSQPDATTAVRGMLAPEADPTHGPISRAVEHIPIIGGDQRAREDLYRRGEKEPGAVGAVHQAAAFVPFAGPALTASQDALDRKDYSGAAGAGVNAFLSMLGLKSALVKPSPVLESNVTPPKLPFLKSADETAGNVIKNNPKLSQGILNALEPRKAAIQYIKSKLAEGAKAAPETGGATLEQTGITSQPEVSPAPYRLSGKQIQDASTVTPRTPFQPKGLLMTGEEATAKPAITSPADDRGIKSPQKRTFMRSTSQDVKEYYNYRFDQLRNEMQSATEAGDQAAVADVQRRLGELDQVQRLHPVEPTEPVKAPQSLPFLKQTGKAANLKMTPEQAVTLKNALDEITNPEQFYGKTPQRSLVKKHQQQMKNAGITIPPVENPLNPFAASLTFKPQAFFNPQSLERTLRKK